MSRRKNFKDINITTHNVRGLKSQIKRHELLTQINVKNLFAVCIQETWTKGFSIHEHNGCILISNGRDPNMQTSRRGQEGVGIVLSQEGVRSWNNAGCEIHKDFGSRILAIRLLMKDTKGNDIGIYLMSAYSPIGSAPDDVWEDYLENFITCLERKRASDVLIVGCDCNSSMGINLTPTQSYNKPSIGRFGMEHRNRAGIRFSTFLETHNLLALSTYFRKKSYATWNHPRSRLPHQIDHIIIQKDDFKRFIDCGNYNPLINSDHISVRCKVRLVVSFRKSQTPRQTISKLDSSVLSNRDVSKSFNDQVVYHFNRPSNDTNNHSKLSCAMKRAAKDILPRKPRPQPDWFTADESNLLKLIDKRNTALKAKINRPTRQTINNLRVARKQLSSATMLAKDKWIASKTNNLNHADASKKGTKICWDSIKSLKQGLTKPKQINEKMMTKPDGSKCKSAEENAEVFKVHFEQLYNRQPTFNPDALDLLDQHPVRKGIDHLPTDEEIKKAVSRLKNNAPGESGLTSQMFKSIVEDIETFTLLRNVVTELWNTETPPSEWDIGLLKILPKKGDLSKPGNYRGIMLLEVSYKIIAIIIHERLQPIVSSIDHESQCGFRPGRGCLDAVFTVKLAMKKRREHNSETWIMFLDLVKAFDRVPRELLWTVLEKFGVPSKLVRIIKSLHQNFKVNFEVDSVSHCIYCTIGVKQGDILGPVLFVIYIAAIMITWRKRYDRPLCIYRSKNDFRMTGRRYNAKGTNFSVPDSEYADDTAVLFLSRQDVLFYTPLLFDHFLSFGMEVHAGDESQPEKPSKTEILYVSGPTPDVDPPNLDPIKFGDGKFIPVTNSFCYLGSLLSRDTNDELDIVSRLNRGSNAFGALKSSIFANSRISLKVKAAVYENLILPIVLYGSETWCLTEKLFDLLRIFHRRCVRAICRVNLLHVRKHRISTQSLLERLGLKSIDCYVTRRQLAWAGHVVRMNYDRLPRKMLSCWVQSKRPKGAPKFTYGRGLFKALKKANVPNEIWFDLANDRSWWTCMLHDLDF